MEQQSVNPHGYAKPLGGFVVVLFVAVFAGGWLYIDAVRNELEMKIAAVQSQVDRVRMESKKEGSEPKKVAAEGTYVVEHEKLPRDDGEMPIIISRIYRVSPDGATRTLLHAETALAEELSVFIIEGRQLVLTRKQVDASPGPCECEYILQTRSYESLDLDDPAIGLRTYEVTPAIEFELQSRYGTCMTVVEATSFCNE